jgi:EAL domain-containing protein (putative c-di-GMP-specific phosphodiesterase class I)
MPTTTPPSPERATSAGEAAQAARVLIVDDDPFMATLLGVMLGRIGPFEAVGETDPAAALQRLRERACEFDGIVVDLNMPGIDGMAFFRHLADIGYAGCVVPFSGEAPEVLESVMQLARSHGLNVPGTLGKPPRLEQLQALPWGCADARATSAGADGGWQPDEQALRQALARGDIGCMYQPKVDLRDGRLVGVESLARWRHAAHGLISPARFVPLAESCGAIRELTRSVLETALAQQARWRAQGLALSMSVNASAQDLGDLGFAELVSERARHHGTQPEDLVIEVTESGLGDDPRLLVEIMSRLRLRRFALSIDDFGSGYSTLSKLRDAVFDEIKIDRDFTHAAHASLRGTVLFDSCTQLGQALGMRVVAEGIEDRLDWDFCRCHGVHLAQGYFISRPLAGEQLPRWHELWRERVLELGLTAPDGGGSERPDHARA